MSFSGQRTTAPLRAVARSAKEKVAETEPQAVACAQLRACSRALSSASPAVSAFLGARCRTLAEGSAGAQQQVPSRLEGCESCGAALLPGSTCRCVHSECLLNQARILTAAPVTACECGALPSQTGAPRVPQRGRPTACWCAVTTVNTRCVPGHSARLAPGAWRLLTSQRVAGVRAGHPSQQAETRRSSRRRAPR